MSYMLYLVDGPCEGSYTTKHAPSPLKAVVATDGKRDVLDAPEDLPRLDETVHVYERIPGGEGHLCMRGRGGRGCFTTVSYQHVVGREVS